jgi:sulfur carrier protein ThiS
MADAASVHVRCGVYELTLEVHARPVGELREQLAEALSIAPTAVAVVNGQLVPETYVINPGDDLEFVRPAGRKGRLYD